jgi:hypothetical protein
MGLLDVVDVVLTHVTGLSALALALTAWRRSRSRPAPITITRPDGQVLTIGGEPEITSDLIVRFLSATDDAASSTPRPGR